jgi:hypothetical protein
MGNVPEHPGHHGHKPTNRKLTPIKDEYNEPCLGKYPTVSPVRDPDVPIPSIEKDDDDESPEADVKKEASAPDSECSTNPNIRTATPKPIDHEGDTLMSDASPLPPPPAVGTAANPALTTTPDKDTHMWDN